jgi:transcriptional regulator with XRE-family HTH domain
MIARTTPVSDEQSEFGAQLRLERERRAITLASVAETTKVAESLLAGLERGDVSRWPSGIYRRAFFREYATAIGLPVDAATGEFLRVFPEAGAAAVERGELRLTLAPEKRLRARAVAARAASAALDAGAVLAIGFVLARALSVNLWIVIAVLALAYQILGAMVMGRSPALWMMRVALSSEGSNQRVRPSSRAVLRVVQTEQRRKAS